MSFCLILLAAGNSSRFKSNIAKPYHKIGGKTLAEISLKKASFFPQIKKVVFVYNQRHKKNLKLINAKNLKFVRGGKTRQESTYKALKYLIKQKFNISGPFSADTVFLRKNLIKFDVIIGMYHDQVLGPMKSIFGFDAINITLGLPFNRVSLDHGPNEKMFGKNKSNPNSLLKALKFLDN